MIFDKKIGTKLKRKRYRWIVRSAVLFGMETMPLIKVSEGKIDTAEMRMQRFMKGVTRRDKIRNEEIRKSFGVEQLLKKFREV